jgi:hypothetical protein
MAVELSNLTFTDQADVFPASGAEVILNNGIANTLAGDDIITGTGINGNFGFHNESYINTGEGNDIITGIDGILNEGIINTGNNNDSIIAEGDFITEFYSLITTGEGNDTITSTNDFYNYGGIATEEGDDIIAITGNFYNADVITTGSGRDSIILNGDYLLIYGGGGIVYLQEDEDYFKGFFEGSDVYGGDGEDTLELPPGNYSFAPDYMSNNLTAILDANTNNFMEISGFEKLRINNTTYDFPIGSVQGIVVT